eukprot:NODE_2746_length_1104_cov_29.532242_g2621_i0.p1 GENE.NODE_2746_length_1104_cov_29.532242_g2621_i0~~NODE_2746_length_1104_cov_29.532242_g2621_i0.p1  ORF type:complete len:341 (-),score=100.99 NODE_2746_length_1104_cov_29.532242_g2621_i0:49-1071(-)
MGASCLAALIPNVLPDHLTPMILNVANESGVVGWKEFLVLMSSHKTSEDQVREAFEFFDVDNSGTISVDEIAGFLSVAGVGHVLTPLEISAIIREIDVNGDGDIDYPEFAASMMKLLPQNHAPGPINTSDHSTTELCTKGAISLKFRRNYTTFCSFLSVRWEGLLRVSTLVATFLITAVPVLLIVCTDWVFWPACTNEVIRIFLASVITLCDLLILIQDWEFPTFAEPSEPGTVEQPVLSFFNVHITGKWFNYGIIFLVMILDLNMTKNQLIYTPASFGQCLAADGISICNKVGPICDLSDCNGAQYHNVILPIKLFCLLPGTLGLVWFLWLLKTYQPTY